MSFFEQGLLSHKIAIPCFWARYN